MEDLKTHLISTFSMIKKKEEKKIKRLSDIAGIKPIFSKIIVYTILLDNYNNDLPKKTILFPLTISSLNTSG